MPRRPDNVVDTTGPKKRTQERSASAAEGPAAREFERYRGYAAVAGYVGFFAGLALVFLYHLMGGFDETWVNWLFFAAVVVAGLAVLGGIGVNYRRIFDLFSSRRGVAGMSVALAVALGTVILVLTNYISYRRSKSWDVTETGRFTLSEQTLNWLRRLDAGDKTMRLVTFIPYDVQSQITGMPPNEPLRVVSGVL